MNKYELKVKGNNDFFFCNLAKCNCCVLFINSDSKCRIPRISLSETQEDVENVVWFFLKKKTQINGSKTWAVGIPKRNVVL